METTMNKPTLTFVIKDYDYLAPLAWGDVTVEGADITWDRKSVITRVVQDPAIAAGELSFSAHLIRLSRGDRSFVGIPFFAYRAFRHRCFFVRKDSGLTSVKQLAGKRIGTNAWPDTGNTWTRAILRMEGVALDSIRWWVGAIDDPTYPSRWQGTEPKYVQPAPQGATLRDMLMAGELDALMCPIPPKGFYAADSKIRRLLENYPAEEKAYLAKVGFYPAHHIVGIRREVFEKHPWLARSLFEALEKSRQLYQSKRKDLAELTPWLQAEIEETVKLLGEDWQPNGVEQNRTMIAALCTEEYAQGLIAKPLDPSTVFEEFEQVTQGY